MGFEFIERQFFLPALVIETDPGGGGSERGVEPRRQQPMPLTRARASRIGERGRDDPHHDPVASAAPIGAVVVALGQEAPSAKTSIGSKMRLDVIRANR